MREGGTQQSIFRDNPIPPFYIWATLGPERGASCQDHTTSQWLCSQAPARAQLSGSHQGTCSPWAAGQLPMGMPSRAGGEILQHPPTRWPAGGWDICVPHHICIAQAKEQDTTREIARSNLHQMPGSKQIVTDNPKSEAFPLGLCL